jgi:hypothetical protein
MLAEWLTISGRDDFSVIVIIEDDIENEFFCYSKNLTLSIAINSCKV